MPGYSESGVDISALDEQLKLSYADRLRWLDQAVANLNALQRAAGVEPYEPDDTSR